MVLNSWEIDLVFLALLTGRGLMELNLTVNAVVIINKRDSVNFDSKWQHDSWCLQQLIRD